MEFFIRNHAFAKRMGILRASKSKSFLFAMPQNTTSGTCPDRLRRIRPGTEKPSDSIKL